jgi:hypothetical protein
MPDIRLIVGEEAVTCELLTMTAPDICAAIQKLLPYETDLHCAKMAGDEVFFPIPLMLDIAEGGTHTHDLSAGVLVYWPNRPLLCAFHEAPQEEDATVAVFAQVTQNLAGLGRICAQTRLRQGARIRIEMA